MTDHVGGDGHLRPKHGKAFRPEVTATPELDRRAIWIADTEARISAHGHMEMLARNCRIAAQERLSFDHDGGYDAVFRDEMERQRSSMHGELTPQLRATVEELTRERDSQIERLLVERHASDVRLAAAEVRNVAEKIARTGREQVMSESLSDVARGVAVGLRTATQIIMDESWTKAEICNVLDDYATALDRALDGTKERT